MVEVASFGTVGSSIETAEITDNAVTEAKLSTALQNAFVPVGTVLSWLQDYTNTPTLPDGWAIADGSTVSDADSPYNGQALPNLTNYFLRGGATSGSTGGADTHRHQWSEQSSGTGFSTTSADGLTWTSSGSTTPMSSMYTTDLYTQTASTLPSYYSVVLIIRIK